MRESTSSLRLEGRADRGPALLAQGRNYPYTEISVRLRSRSELRRDPAVAPSAGGGPDSGDLPCTLRHDYRLSWWVLACASPPLCWPQPILLRTFHRLKAR